MSNRLLTNRPHAARAAFVIAGALAALAAASPAEAQRRQPVVATAAPAHPAMPVQVVPYPGATVTLDSRVYGPQHRPSQGLHAQGLHAQGLRPRYPQVSAGYYIPEAVGYGYYPPAAYSRVTDANGRPLTDGGLDAGGVGQFGYGLGTPNLTGASYVVGEGGAMSVDFGRGDRRTVPSCAALAAATDPDGRPRTIFYSAPMDGLILRAGESGRVAGEPPKGTQACYTADAYGRVVLDY